MNFSIRLKFTMAHNTPANKTILLAGASVRALAHSCLRAGLTPWCMDCFADHDLLNRCNTICIHEGYPESILKALDLSPQGPLMFTGGLENHPRLLDNIQRIRPIAGIHGQSLQNLRHVPEWSSHLLSRGLRVPGYLEMAPDTGPDVRWLAKPYRGSGGRGIFRTQDSPPPGFFLQEFIPGQSRSASFCFHEHRWEFLGATLQIPPQPWLHSTGFQYSGNIGPIELKNQERQDLESIAESLAEFARPCGLLNLDYILSDDHAIPLEINPRYSASMELLELALGRSLIDEHLQGTGWGHLCHTLKQPPSRPGGVLGKAIYYARESFRFPDHLPEFKDSADLWAVPEFADIPASGQSISPGQPVLSLFAQGTSPDAVLSKLKEQSQKVELFLAGERAYPNPK